MGRRFLAWVQFDGGDFCGFARQGELRSVAHTLEQGWFQWRGERLVVKSSSRTDSGVHAARMPVALETDSKVPAKAVVHGWNAHLPDDLAIQSAHRVGEEFHVRHDAIGKRYVYRIWNGRTRSPQRRRDHWHITRPLDVPAMQAAAPAYIGSHDFSAFRSVHCQSMTTRRAIRRVDVSRDGELVQITVEGNAFLHNMVRIMVGTLVEIGWGKIEPHSLSGIIEGGQRRRAGQTAPALGLTLADVFYGPHGGREGLNFKKLDGQHRSASGAQNAPDKPTTGR